MLEDILKSKKCFKFICAAGNEDEKEVEKLCTIYSLAGANFFDVAAKKSVIKAAKRGLARAKKLGAKDEKYICVSCAVKGDKHINKAEIDINKCSNCGLCEGTCLQNAIIKENNKRKINSLRCIGCEKCTKICPKKAIGTKNYYKDLEFIAKEAQQENVNCIEFHAISKNVNEIKKDWQTINNNFKGILSICIDRSKLGNEDIIDLIKNLIETRTPYSTIVQADGAPMSGGCDNFKTTLQAVATAEIIQNANLPVYTILSGGTNSKSTELAKMCEVDISGVAIGSFARKIISQYVKRDDFFENKEIFTSALEIAQALVKASLSNL